MPEVTERSCLRCEGNMEGKRPHAIYCSRTCKTVASDQRRRAEGRGREIDRARYAREGERRRAYARQQSRATRSRAFGHFGDRCVDCGSQEKLELDHVNGNGERHRDQVGHGDAFYRYLIKQGFPAECEAGGEYELQILCRRCHTEKTKRERRERG